jgi:hypothetical protein
MGYCRELPDAGWMRRQLESTFASGLACLPGTHGLLTNAGRQLFYKHGINTVGIERIIEHADVKYPRATPEKALLDWLYLGASRYSKMAGPPLDLELERLDASRLRRLARGMGLTEELAEWRARKRDYFLAF